MADPYSKFAQFAQNQPPPQQITPSQPWSPWQAITNYLQGGPAEQPVIAKPVVRQPSPPPVGTPYLPGAEGFQRGFKSVR